MLLVEKFTPKCLALLLLVPLHLSAHHASAPHYDHSKDVLIENAVITEFKMVNPHSFIYFDAPGNDNEVSNWRCELRPAAVLQRMGWTQETLAVGQSVTVTGNPAWREADVCLLQAIVFPDGTEIGPRTDLSETGSNGGRVQVVENDRGNRPLLLANGQPNISGDWVSLSFTRGGLGGGSGEPNNGFDPSQENIAAADGYDVRFDDPVLHCHPINIIQGWNHDVHVHRITQLDDRVVMHYGFVDLIRTIYLDSEHPDHIEPSIGGHSIGRWEEDVLVVDTVGFIPGVLSHRVGVLHSEQMHISERIYYDQVSGELVRDYVVEDPLYLNTPYVNQDRQRVSTESFSSYDCLDLSGKNNLRPEA